MKQHRNNIGVLRLLFAALVIMGHAPEQIDGDRHREPLTMLFHTISLGELSVDAFFLLSGYLITKSWVSLQSPRKYIVHRALRIYPAFVIAFLVSAFVVGPLVGADVATSIPEMLGRLVGLQEPPRYAGQLTGLHYPDLNDSMWTIAYEFRCYLLVGVLGLCGLLARRGLMLGLTGLSMLAMVGATFHVFRTHLDALGAHHRLTTVIGDPWPDVRLTSTFLVGSCVYLFHDEVFRRLDWKAAAACVCAATLCLLQPHTAEVGLIAFGGAALFWLAYKARLGALQRVNDSWDISYGVYLYGWPIADLIRWHDRGITPLALAALTLPLAAMAGTASWWGVEKWTKNLGRRQARSGPTQPEVLIAGLESDAGLKIAVTPVGSPETVKADDPA